jgi:hypothetical protein
MPKKKVTKIKIQSYVLPHTYAAMQVAAEKGEATISDVIQAAIAMYLSEHHPHANFMTMMEDDAV